MNSPDLALYRFAEPVAVVVKGVFSDVDLTEGQRIMRAQREEKARRKELKRHPQHANGMPIRRSFASGILILCAILIAGATGCKRTHACGAPGEEYAEGVRVGEMGRGRHYEAPDWASEDFCRGVADGRKGKDYSNSPEEQAKLAEVRKILGADPPVKELAEPKPIRWAYEPYPANHKWRVGDTFRYYETVTGRGRDITYTVIRAPYARKADGHLCIDVTTGPQCAIIGWCLDR